MNEFRNLIPILTDSELMHVEISWLGIATRVRNTRLYKILPHSHYAQLCLYVHTYIQINK